ncbi:MAG: cytochrome c biogenesis protein CcsA [Candidatus Poseidoniaceae archaeon]|jgi:cytochrome c-type biogenesis protein CcmF|nr:cytochrome c biogenesis protein CcsA [Candidatus Poseidoniaceae archaeon]
MESLLMPFAILGALLLIYHPKSHFSFSAIIALPFIVLSIMFTLNIDTIHLVAWYGGEELPLRYRFAATWAAREGPILLWAAWMAVLAMIWRKPLSKENEETHIMRLRLMYGFALTLLLVAWILDPFKSASGFGPGLNELLQTDLMVIHPPLIFLAYSLCITLACIAVSSMITGQNGIKERLIEVTRPAFFFATLGIGLGGLWAYLILDWGGYWAWDPVETGSLLPWICLVAILHLRTRPGKTPDHIWAGFAMAAGALALFATMVTRAGGVWAVSVHTFVVNSTGSPPEDVFGRLMILLSDNSGIEVVVYLLGIIQLIAIFLAHRLNYSYSKLWLLLLPITALTGVIGGGDVLNNLPPTVVVLLGLGPFIESGIRSLPEGHDWKWFAIPAVMVILRIFHGMVMFELISLLFAFGLIFENERLKAWGWACAGIVFFLAASWSGMLEIWMSGIGMGAFIAPWFVNGDNEETKFSFSERNTQQRIALWTPVVAVGLYLILTLVILMSSIDSIQFAAHELYGAPFIAAIMIALVMWSMRKNPSRVFLLIISTPLILVMAWFYGDSLGYDSTDILGSSLSRGQIGMIVLIPALLALPATFSLIRENTGKTKIPMFAHIIHLGLVLMIIGHVMSTTIIDRGNYSHSVTLIKDEKVGWEGYEFEFTDVVTQTENLEVGDGYLGAEINVYEDGEFIETVEPGVIRFDTSSRSEVDRISMWHGDLVIIMDGTQARSLMEGSDLVRIMVYDLPGIHLVWSGWVLILLASLRIWIPQRDPTD